MIRFENVATPATAATVGVAASENPAGPATVIVTLPVNDVIVWPLASCAVTWTAGVIATPATVCEGGTVNTRLNVGFTLTWKSVAVSAFGVGVGNDTHGLNRFVLSLVRARQW